MSNWAHQKAFYHISKLPADVKGIPELYLQSILRKGAGRPSYRCHPAVISLFCSLCTYSLSLRLAEPLLPAQSLGKQSEVLLTK